MKRYRFITRTLGICLAGTLAFTPAAYAAVTVPPISVGDNGQESSGGAGPGASGGSGTSTETGPGSGGSSSGSGTSSAGNGTSTGSGSSTSSTSTGNSSSTGTTETAQKPVVQAEAAVLIDGATGKVLFGKNENAQYYPASITKIMTALLVLENSKLSDIVTYSESATTNLESGAVTLSITAGDKLTVEQSLYGLMLKSANEIANGLAEHVSGSVSGFTAKMNQRAKELGCQNTNFTNPSGLNGTEHKTTPYDMALIAREAFRNETFRKIDMTLSYEFPATQKAAARTITMGHKMMYKTDSRYYEGIIGGKTGYTSKAGNTLVTGVERDGVQLIAVVMKSSSTHYTDTKALLDYGFANYQALTGNSAPAGPGDDSSGGSQGGSAGSQQSEVSKWQQDSTGWYYIKADGTRAKNEWLTIEGNDYWFDSNEYMATGWRQFSNGAWYYFRSGGAMARNYWVQTDGVWFYLGADGVLLTNARTPEGYWVNEVGIWVEGQSANQ